jgi:enoyl-CoA hydratase
MTVLPTYETLLVEWKAQGVLGITLNRPDERNAVDAVMHYELIECLRALQEIPDVGAVVLGAVGPTFCAGGDVRMLAEIPTQDWRTTVRTMDEALRIVQELLMVGPPVVAAVGGHAVGLGATIALLCDVIVMSDEAVLADPHVKIGIVAGDGGTLVWPAALGPSRAKEYLMTGDPVPAAKACEWGMVNHVTAPDVVEAKALEIAVRLAGGARQAIAWTKQVVNMSLLREALAQLPLAMAHEARTMTQPDLVEGAAAFLERRPPAWPSNVPA